MRSGSGLQITGSDLRGALWSLITTSAGVGLAIAVMPGVFVTHWWSVLLAALIVSTGDILVRPLLRALAMRLGAVGALVLGVAAQVATAWVALTYLPGINAVSWTDVVVILIIAGAFMAVGRWLVGAHDIEYILGDLLRRSRRAARRRSSGSRGGVGARGGSGSWGGRNNGRMPDSRATDKETEVRALAGEAAQPAQAASSGTPAGMVIVQLDGVSRSTLDFALQAGLAPTLARWLGTGTHKVETWWARVPSTTPASQAGLLHGTTDHVPAFRWWDRELGRLIVTNRPADAARVEQLLSDGAGLLAGGGVAVSTMFSGDAKTSLLVMSRARQGLGPGQMFVHFFASPFVLVRALIGTIGEYFKELYQGWQQALRRVHPRVSRLGAYPVLRAVSNVILRDLNTSLVAEQIADGAPVIFVDLVDYDEIAHHAGPLRPEAMRSLEGLDRVISLWEQVALVGPRRYEFVVLSDHGQSLGRPFEQVTGRSFAAEVRRLMALPAPAPPRHEGTGGEDWGSLNTALNAFGRSAEPKVLVGPDRAGEAQATAPETGPDVAVVGSGNLGMIWFPRLTAPVEDAVIRHHWPALVPGLLANPAVGVLITRDGTNAIARNRRGSMRLDTGQVDGEDPLAPYGPQAAADLLRVASMANSGDIIVLSGVDKVGMVHAFEGLVGSHGGIGGAQNDAILIYPGQLPIPDAERESIGALRMLVGAEAVHARLVAWLEQLGIRQPTQPATVAESEHTGERSGMSE